MPDSLRDAVKEAKMRYAIINSSGNVLQWFDDRASAIEQRARMLADCRSRREGRVVMVAGPRYPAKVIAEAPAEKLHWLADPERAQELAEAVLAALAAAGFPVGEPRDVNEIIEPPIPWGRVRELLLGDETVDKAAHSLFDGVAAIERSATYAALAAAVDHAEKEGQDG